MKISTIKQYYSCLSKTKMFGVDINNKDMKILQIENHKGKHNITGWAKKLLPAGVIEDFEVKDRSKFVEILKNALDTETAKKIKGSSVVLSVPEDKVFLRILDVPSMEDSEMGEAIKWGVEENIPISIDEVYYDWQIVHRGKKNMKVLVAASPRRVIDSLIESFEEAGLHVQILEADSMATGRSLFAKDENDPVLVVDIGIEGTGYFIYHDGYPAFSSSGSVSGQMFTDAVAKYYELEWKKAEHFKTKVGLGNNKKEREEALRLYSPLLSTLIQEIEKTMVFYDENLRGKTNKKVDKIIVCGGGSNLKGIIPFLSINLKMNITQGDPWKNVLLDKGIPPVSKEEAQSYITVIGLGIKSCNYGHHD